MATLNLVLFALTAKEKTDHLMRISKHIYSQNIFWIVHFTLDWVRVYSFIVLFNYMKLSSTQCL